MKLPYKFIYCAVKTISLTRISQFHQFVLNDLRIKSMGVHEEKSDIEPGAVRAIWQKIDV